MVLNTEESTRRRDVSLNPLVGIGFSGIKLDVVFLNVVFSWSHSAKPVTLAAIRGRVVRVVVQSLLFKRETG